MISRRVRDRQLLDEEDLAEDYRRMIYAPTVADMEKARVAFGRMWKLRCKAAWTSFEEAGDRLFTFLRHPVAQWKALRTTNALERINESAAGPRPRRTCRARLPSCCCSSA
jgi:transposase-like protein